MSESLAGAAVNVEDIANLLQLWLDRALCYTADISASMSELLEIGSISHTLDNALSSPAYHMVRHSIEEELYLILKSLNQSLVVVRKSLGSVGPIEYLSSAVCEQSWGNLHAIFLLEGPTLYERLELYRLYLQSLFTVLQGYEKFVSWSLSTNLLLVTNQLQIWLFFTLASSICLQSKC